MDKFGKICINILETYFDEKDFFHGFVSRFIQRGYKHDSQCP